MSIYFSLKRIYVNLVFDAAMTTVVILLNFWKKCTCVAFKHVANKQHVFSFPYTRFSFYKNILYKNIEDEMGQKVKNILRICSS